MKQRYYAAIDLKSFYASAECIQRGLNPLNTNLVVADLSRTEKTICLAVTPSLKSYGIPGRARLFEVIQKVREVNAERQKNAPDGVFSGLSYFDSELKQNSSLKLDFIVAPPRMAYYMELSTKIYQIYLKYVSSEDIHVYSVDEVFIDVTDYLETYKMSAYELTRTMIKDVLKQTGITATAGIGTNLYLCKIAMDIVAKHIPSDRDGVRIAELDERSYRELLWNHQPLTDFWRIGAGYVRRLNKYGLHTMGDIAEFSLKNEDILYEEFGIYAELLIDHAWGWEPCRISDIKSYKPQDRSLSLGQVLAEPYNFEKARLIIKEMTQSLVLELVDKRLTTDQMVLTVGYDIQNNDYKGEFTLDRYGRKVPKQAHGSENIGEFTSSISKIYKTVLHLFDRIVDKDLLVRRMYIVANHIAVEGNISKPEPEQLSLFVDYSQREKELNKEKERLEKEKNLQLAVLSLQKRYGKNAVLKGINLEEGATAIDRNKQIGGHKA
ncbi:MAG: DNA methylase [Ruminococcaceae bacterium]|nr:DNA methylase [Oscillospiraceae bacterium]